MPSLVADAVASSEDRSLINIFAGIAVATRQDVDLDAYIARHCYMFGTSGSVVRDMEVLLSRTRRRVGTPTCRSTRSLAWQVQQLAWRRCRTGSWPARSWSIPLCTRSGLLSLAELGGDFPSVASKLDDGHWCLEAERELLKVAGSQPPALVDGQHECTSNGPARRL